MTWMKIIIDQTLKGVLERMKNEGLDKESAMDRIIDLGVKQRTPQQATGYSSKVKI
jgi:hypothetical protein